MLGITQEQMDLVAEVADKYEDEFKAWADENESRLMKWYDENEYEGLFTTPPKFAYFCSVEFMKYKNGNT